MPTDLQEEYYPDEPIQCAQCGWPDSELDDLQSACIDDLCHGGEVPCMHGDWATLSCGLCGH